MLNAFRGKIKNLSMRINPLKGLVLLKLYSLKFTDSDYITVKYKVVVHLMIYHKYAHSLSYLSRLMTVPNHTLSVLMLII